MPCQTSEALQDLKTALKASGSAAIPTAALEYLAADRHFALRRWYDHVAVLAVGSKDKYFRLETYDVPWRQVYDAGDQSTHWRLPTVVRDLNARQFCARVARILEWIAGWISRPEEWLNVARTNGSDVDFGMILENDVTPAPLYLPDFTNGACRLGLAVSCSLARAFRQFPSHLPAEQRIRSQSSIRAEQSRGNEVSNTRRTRSVILRLSWRARNRSRVNVAEAA